MGIEPTPQAWEARVLPLNYTRLRAELVTCPGRGMQSKYHLSATFQWPRTVNEAEESSKKELAGPSSALLAYPR